MVNEKDRNVKGCSFGQVTRERVDNFIEMFNDFKENDFRHLAEKVEQIANRPSWAVSVIIWILSSTVVGLAVRAIILGG